MLPVSTKTHLLDARSCKLNIAMLKICSYTRYKFRKQRYENKSKQEEVFDLEAISGDQWPQVPQVRQMVSNGADIAR